MDNYFENDKNELVEKTNYKFTAKERAHFDAYRKSMAIGNAIKRKCDKIDALLPEEERHRQCEAIAQEALSQYETAALHVSYITRHNVQFLSRLRHMQGLALVHLRRYDEALEYFYESWDISVRALGDKNLYLAWLTKVMAQTFLEKGDLLTCELLLKYALIRYMSRMSKERGKFVLGTMRDRVIGTLRSIAECYRRTGRVKAAESLERTANNLLNHSQNGK